jgi:hypothetical protein
MTTVDVGALERAQMTRTTAAAYIQKREIETSNRVAAGEPPKRSALPWQLHAPKAANNTRKPDIERPYKISEESAKGAEEIFLDMAARPHPNREVFRQKLGTSGVIKRWFAERVGDMLWWLGLDSIDAEAGLAYVYHWRAAGGGAGGQEKKSNGGATAGSGNLRAEIVPVTA